jgi:hypothetical protein
MKPPRLNDDAEEGNKACETAPREPAETDTPKMAYQGGKATSLLSGRYLGAKQPILEGCFRYI